MIRLLFVSCFVSILFSCDYSSNTQPLVYQMSEADSVRCMEEILDEILEDGRAWQTQREIELSKINYPMCFPPEHFSIVANSAGQVMVDGEIDSLDLVSELYDFFMFNRNLPKSEVEKYVSDINYEGFDKPFYNHLSSEKNQRKVQEEAFELARIRKIDGVDSALVDYQKSKVQDWEKRKFTLNTIGSDYLPELLHGVHAIFEYQKEDETVRRILNEIAFTFYQIRNYECLRYFKETYLDLYERAQRKRRKIDLDRLEALKCLHPPSIVINSTKIDIHEEEPPIEVFE